MLLLPLKLERWEVDSVSHWLGILNQSVSHNEDSAQATFTNSMHQHFFSFRNGNIDLLEGKHWACIRALGLRRNDRHQLVQSIGSLPCLQFHAIYHSTSAIANACNKRQLALCESSPARRKSSCPVFRSSTTTGNIGSLDTWCSKHLVAMDSLYMAVTWNAIALNLSHVLDNQFQKIDIFSETHISTVISIIWSPYINVIVYYR